MKTFILSSLIAAFTASATFAESARYRPAGYKPARYSPLRIEAPHHGRDILGAVWYPSPGPGSVFTFGDNPVFHGVTVIEEAPVQIGTHPVVLLSHGMGGNIRSLAWLASGLAEREAIVVSVNHPNTTWGDFDMTTGIKHWTRVQDLSTALDALAVDPRFKDRLDANRVMAAGFSYGGWTALSMGGLKGNLRGFIAQCHGEGEPKDHCDDGIGTEITDPKIEPSDWDASYVDPRVTHVVAIEPGLIWGLNAGDTNGVIDHVRLIAFGDQETRKPATDFDKSGLTALLPNAKITRFAPAIHFTALPLCKPMAEAILIEEQDDPVCSDPAGTNREAVHNTIIDQILADLAL